MARRRRVEFQVYEKEMRNPSTIKRDKEAIRRKMNATLVGMQIAIQRARALLEGGPESYEQVEAEVREAMGSKYK